MTTENASTAGCGVAPASLAANKVRGSGNLLDGADNRAEEPADEGG
jgi:hypothetical protein